MPFSYRSITIVAAAAACLALMPGCDRRTPEERLQTAFEFYQQGDALSAEMEAQKVVDKAPEDPAALQASALLAQIYASQNRFDEAEMQLKTSLENVSQLEPAGKDMLRMYLSLLNTQGKFDEALKVVDKYQEEYSEDEGTSLSLTVAKADIQMQAGETTPARTILTSLIDRTTDTLERSIYRDMYLRSYMVDQNTTAAIEYLEQNMADFQGEQEKQSALIGLASLYGANGDYEKSRQYLDQITSLFMDTIRKEVDRRAKMGLSVQLGQVYQTLGNLPGARRIFQAIYESGISDPQVITAAVNGLTENLLRQGDTSATADLLRDAAAKHPQAPFKQQLQQMEEVIAKGQLESVAPVDTSTLTMKYREDPNILWPSDLPAVLGVSTTGTATTAAGTTATQAAPPVPEASAPEAAPANEDTPAPAATEAPAAPQEPATPVAEQAPATTPAPETPATTPAPEAPQPTPAEQPPPAPDAETTDSAPQLQ